MLPKSSGRVDHVIKLANRIAHEYDLEYVGTEHLLLAIQREGTGVGAAILAKRGVTEEKLKEEIEKLVKAQL
ncbi:MAG: Clp protease N-terminal domain-containing protein, partial [Phycisphaerae bacterium]